MFTDKTTIRNGKFRRKCYLVTFPHAGERPVTTEHVAWRGPKHGTRGTSRAAARKACQARRILQGPNDPASSAEHYNLFIESVLARRTMRLHSTA